MRPFRPLPRQPLSRRPSRGQSLVEFGLVLPIMLMLFLGIADLGRVFAAGVVLEAAARDGAEIAANLYLSDPPGTGSLDAPVTGASSGEYAQIRAAAAAALCQEMQALPNTAGTGPDCAGMPIVRICVHDNADPGCGGDVFGAPIPPECSQTAATMSPSQSGGSGERWVEVRACYRFSLILPVPLIDFGDIWLERTRSFGIPCYFVLGDQPCG